MGFFEGAGKSMGSSWNTLDGAGKMGAGMGIAQGATSLVEQGVGNLQSPDVNTLFNSASSMTKSGLAGEARAFQGADAGRVKVGGQIAKGAATGAMAGAAFGP